MNSHNNSQAKVLFSVQPDEDGYPSVKSESLWSTPLGDARYQIDNIPFYVRGISAGDVVTAVPDEAGVLRFQSIVMRAGHSTIRILVTDESKVAAVRSELQGLGCESEQDSVPQLVAVDVPPDVDIGTVWSRLARGSEVDELDYEDACIQHRV